MRWNKTYKPEHEHPPERMQPVAALSVDTVSLTRIATRTGGVKLVDAKPSSRIYSHHLSRMSLRVRGISPVDEIVLLRNNRCRSSTPTGIIPTGAGETCISRDRDSRAR